MSKNISDYLVVHHNQSTLHRTGEDPITYAEGKLTDEAKARYANIRTQLEKGYLENKINECSQPDVKIENLSNEQKQLIDKLVDSVTSEVGRAIVGLTVLQLTIKSIEPVQSVRLHKGSSNNSNAFSWKEGLPMRVIDKNFITPVLRKYKLLKLNADGFMMTRSLAENYPYSGLYKAAIRGARLEWIEITNLLEDGHLPPEDSLKYIISSLLNKSDEFQKLSDDTIVVLEKYLESDVEFKDILSLVKQYVETSEYSARIFEVSLHSFFQSLDELKLLSGDLKPLSQMRSANKKHGNIGDIEVTSPKNSHSIIESWDAKYGKSYLRDELEEISDKLELHVETEIAGFVTNQDPDLREEIQNRLKEIEELFNISIYIQSFEEWVNFQIKKYSVDANLIGSIWIKCLTESLCQKRRVVAPIDEPTYEWVLNLNKLISSKLK